MQDLHVCFAVCRSGILLPVGFWSLVLLLQLPNGTGLATTMHSFLFVVLDLTVFSGHTVSLSSGSGIVLMPWVQGILQDSHFGHRYNMGIWRKRLTCGAGDEDSCTDASPSLLWQGIPGNSGLQHSLKTLAVT